MNIDVDYEAINQMAADARSEAKYSKSLKSTTTEETGPNKKLINTIKSAEGKQNKRQKSEDAKKRANQKRKSAGAFGHQLGSDSDSDSEDSEMKKVKKRSKQEPIIISPEQAKRTLFVSNLPHTTDISDLKDVFPGIGNISIQRRGAKCRGSAFLTMNTFEDADLAVKNKGSYSVLGNTISVEFKKVVTSDSKLSTAAVTSWVKEGEQETDRKTVFIKKLPLGVNISTVKEVLEEGGGPIDEIHFTSNRRSIIMQFATEEGSRQALLKKTFTVRGEELTVQPSTISYGTWSGQKSTKQTTKSWLKKPGSPSKSPSKSIATNDNTTAGPAEGSTSDTTKTSNSDNTNSSDIKKDVNTDVKDPPKAVIPEKAKPKVSVFSFKPRTVRK